MITKKLKAGEIVKINGIPLSLCQDTEVETHEGNAPMVWSESGEIIRSGFGTSGSPIGNFRNEESVVRVDELLEVVAKTLGCRVDTLKAPIRLQDADGVELGEFVVKRLVIALLSEVVAKGVECHGGNVVSSDISLENVKCGGTAAQDSQSEANEGRCPPLPPTTCSPS